MLKPLRWPSLLITAVMTVLLALAAPAAGIAASRDAAVTRVAVFHPWGVRGKTLYGSCWTSSSAAWRPDAWRCLSGNQILDPCFSTSGAARSVVCQVLPPFTGRGLRLVLTKPLPLSQHGIWPRLPHAWIVQLARGVTCAFLTSMPPPMADPHTTPPSYGCSDGTFLLAPHRGRLWSAERLWLHSALHGYTIRRRQLAWILTVWE